MAITVHFEHDGHPMAMLLDVVEVPRSHTGASLAEAFVDTLRAFKIENKVGFIRFSANKAYRQIDTLCFHGQCFKQRHNDRFS